MTIKWLRCLALVAALASAVVFPLAASAEVLFAATGAGGALSTLYTIDESTGAGTAIGPIGFNVSGIAFDPTTEILYGLSGAADPPAELITIDTTTGAGTLVGTVTGAVTAQFPDITFDAAGQLYAWTENGDRLVRIDKATAVVTFVSPFSVPSQITGLAFSHSGTLFLETFGILHIIDPVTGANLGTVGDGARQVGVGMDFNESDVLYALERLGLDRNLVTVNTSNAAITTIGPTVAGLDALAFQISAVPEPATLALLMIGLVGLGFSRRKRSSLETLQ